MDSKAEGLGTIAWWGFSPTIDLSEYLSNIHRNPNGNLFFYSQCPADTRRVNILTVGCSDAVNILRTVANVTGHSIRPLKVGQAMHDFRICTDETGIDELSKILDITKMKYKERDILEYIFKFWTGDKASEFDIFKCWDYRLRKHLGTRYDAIPNVFDWDCSITLHDRNANQIQPQEYARWRRRGVAFELRQAEYLISNRTLASGRAFKNCKGDKSLYWGYWGDITTSPYIRFGIDTAHCPQLSKKVNGKRVFNATLTSEVSVRQILWQLQHHTLCPLSVAAPFCEEMQASNHSDSSTPDAPKAAKELEKDAIGDNELGN